MGFCPVATTTTEGHVPAMRAHPTAIVACVVLYFAVACTITDDHCEEGFVDHCDGNTAVTCDRPSETGSGWSRGSKVRREVCSSGVCGPTCFCAEDCDVCKSTLHHSVACGSPVSTMCALTCNGRGGAARRGPDSKSTASRGTTCRSDGGRPALGRGGCLRGVVRAMVRPGGRSSRPRRSRGSVGPASPR